MGTTGRDCVSVATQLAAATARGEGDINLAAGETDGRNHNLTNTTDSKDTETVEKHNTLEREYAGEEQNNTHLQSELLNFPSTLHPLEVKAEGTGPTQVREAALDGIPTRITEGPETDIQSGSVTSALPASATASQRMIAALVEAGIDTYFGIPGGPVSPVFDAILNVPGARLVESRHETAAVFSAVGYYRASGKVPAVLVTAGPGATNAVTGIVSAHLERVPMVVICGDVAWSTGGGKLLQDTGPEGIGIEQMLTRVTRATIRVSHPGSAVGQGMAALQAATDPYRPGPALLVVPIQHARAQTPPSRVEASATPRQLTVPPRVEVVEQVCQRLVAAKRPLIVLGQGCRPYARIMRRLVDVLDIPFVTTPQAKGLISETHPRSLRHGGLAASLWARAYTAEGVDVALVLGTDLDDCSVGPTPYLGPGGYLVHVDLDATVFNRNLPTALAVTADVGSFAQMLYNLAAARGLRNSRAADIVTAVRETSAFDEPDFASDDAVVIRPHRAIADLERAAPEALFVTDIGEHMLFALHYLTARGPDQFRIGLNLGSMGSGITAAIGMSLAHPQRPVICVCGDGGMQMAGMEVLVAVQERLPIIYAVFNDARYNMVYHGFKQVFGHEAPWSSPWIDFAEWARSMGVSGVRIERPGDINVDLLARLTAARMPAVLDIRIDRDVRMRGGGRNEALQHMSMLSESAAQKAAPGSQV